MTVRYGFKPALLRARRTCSLDGTTLTLQTPAGNPDWVLDLTSVTGLAYSDQTIGYTRIRRLELDTPTGRKLLGQSLGAPGNGPAAQEFFALVLAILQTVHAHAPNIEILYGQRGSARWGMFLAGAFSFCVGLGLPIVALATSPRSDVLTQIALPCLALILLGVVFGWRNRPWTPAPRLPLSALIDLLQISDRSKPLTGSVPRDTAPPPQS